MKIERDILSIASDYSTLFLDFYGVLFDGVEVYNDAINTLSELKKLGKKIIIISNSSQIVSDASEGYSQRGIYDEWHYDTLVTSGEYLRHLITKDKKQLSEIMGFELRSVKCLFMANINIFRNTDIIMTDSADDADAIYIGIPKMSYGRVRVDDLYNINDEKINIADIIKCDWKNVKNSDGNFVLREYVALLEKYLQQNKVLMVANPDIFAYGSIGIDNKKYPLITQGAIGQYYEKLGGSVKYFGKPCYEIFKFADKSNKNEKILFVGDTPWTDIIGAGGYNIDSAMTLTGVTRPILESMPTEWSFDEKIKYLFKEISPNLSFNKEIIFPNYIIEKFAHDS